jgi:uncharacterized coiled-coil DUF342 family protein
MTQKENLIKEYEEFISQGTISSKRSLFTEDTRKVIDEIIEVYNKGELKQETEEEKQEKIDELVKKYHNQEPPEEIYLPKEELAAAKKTLKDSIRQTKESIEKLNPKESVFYNFLELFNYDFSKKVYEKTRKKTELGIKYCDLTIKLLSIKEKEKSARINEDTSTCIEIAKYLKKQKETIDSLEKELDDTSKEIEEYLRSPEPSEYQNKINSCKEKIPKLFEEIDKSKKDASYLGTDLRRYDRRIEFSKKTKDSYKSWIKNIKSQKNRLEELLCCV